MPRSNSRKNDSAYKKRNRDISPHPQIKLEREKLERMLEQAPIPLAIFEGPDHRFVFTNSVYVNTFFGGKEVLGKTIMEAVPEVINLGFLEILNNVYKTGHPQSIKEVTVVLNQKDGSKKEFVLNASFEPTRNLLGEVDGIFVADADVTLEVQGRKKLEEANKTLSRFKAVADSSIDFIGFSDPHGHFLYVNPQGQKMSGVECRAECQKNVLQFFHPKHRKFASENFRRLESEDHFTVETMLQNQLTGEEIPVSWTSFKVRDSGTSEFLGYALIFRDITSLKISAAQLKEAKELAEHASQAKSLFLANMSHEIRAPLAAIMGFTDLLKSPELSASDRQKFLETISRNGKALARIIDDILDLAKVEAGKLEIENVDFSLIELLNEVLALFRDRPNASQIELNLEPIVGMPSRIRSDPTRVRQVLINIIGNAVKFTHHGAVSISVKREFHSRNPEIFKFTVLVKDTGVGLTPEQRDRLFQPFVQADNSMGRKYGGTGLGLHLSNRLAKALGGEITIQDSTLGKGTTFAISFLAAPAAKAGEPALAPIQQSVNDSVLAGKEILLIDDSIDNQELVRLILESHGASVDCANDGREGYEAALKKTYDAILMDLQMPVMNGYEATKALRAAGCRSPILAFTAHAMSEERVKAEALGFNAYLTKPLDQAELISAIQGCAAAISLAT